MLGSVTRCITIMNAGHGPCGRIVIESKIYLSPNEIFTEGNRERQGAKLYRDGIIPIRKDVKPNRVKLNIIREPFYYYSSARAED